MLSLHACRRVLEDAGAEGLAEAEVERLRYVLALVLRVELGAVLGVATEVPPPPAVP